MQTLKCEMCGGGNLIKQDGLFVCQNCGTKYTVEEAKKMMIEGTVDVKGIVKVDNSAFIEKYLANARRAIAKEDWEETEKYYNMVEQNLPNNIEAVFFSAYGKVMSLFYDNAYYKREHAFKVLNKSISVISDYYEDNKNDRETTIRNICSYIKKMGTATFVYDPNVFADVGSKTWTRNLIVETKKTLIKEIDELILLYNDEYLKELKGDINVTAGGCYIATCVYGSYDCPQVWTLRRYRDNTLAKKYFGRKFIKTYYKISPKLVNRFGDKMWFKNFWKKRLDKKVIKLQKRGVEDTPYYDA